MSKIAIDTNILLYSIDQFDPVKQDKSIELIAQSPYISSQMISEFSNICLRKWKFPKEKVGAIVTTLVNKCEFIPVNRQIILQAMENMQTDRLRFCYARSIHAALNEGSKTLYSEDMHVHG